MAVTGGDVESTAISAFEQKKAALKSCLKREYTTFFQPFESKYYVNNVKFIDPLNELEGTQSYQNNVDLLGGRTPLGSLIFKDASIVLHSVEDTGTYSLRSRWTLRVCFKALPWAPVARFTGVSDYTIDEDARVVEQRDYWDSINLKDGAYTKVGKLEGLKDFLGQVFPEDSAESSGSRELPYELLRRGKDYEVRRYPAYEGVKTGYQTRPEAYDRLDSYGGGYNADKLQLEFLVPSILVINKDDPSAEKTMEWPIRFKMPYEDEFTTGAISTPDSEVVEKVAQDSQVVAVFTFSAPATEQYVKYYTNQLQDSIERDGLKPQSIAKASYILAQYDAIFSIKKRRNEVWVPLEAHDW
eukprot:CAMPEP_0113935524 /NCGR_PEP_ID=MMETSP1339-20121228/2672_1 /TAXON_ID=94617 /ORGANISM="Fibrocapsa japonica" /LENGTH=355 /DNA_ID=CAMNT_0000937715 /DNA_START=111 /DNA_END=1175 /DNA_ORIENTATION=- /assembly_acc=CAM_ASM_000762